MSKITQIPQKVANKLYEAVLEYYEHVQADATYRGQIIGHEAKMAELASLLCEADGDPHVKVLVTHTEATDGVAYEVAKAYMKGKINDVCPDDHEEDGDKYLLRFWVPLSRVEDFLTDLRAEGLEARADGIPAGCAVR
jgi:hypothetical protein